MKVMRKIIEIDEELCDGCGECFRLCPVSAIRMIPRAAPQETAGAPSPQIQARGDAHD